MHGCSSCYDADTFNALLKKRMGTLYKSTINYHAQLKQHGFDLKIMWSCTWEKLKNANQTIQKELKAADINRDVLKIREALKGGRVSTIYAAYTVQDSEKIKYLDIVSLYPYTMKTKEYPIGHPQIVTENFSKIEEYFGLIYCKVLPPNSLRLGVLPYTSQEGKLTFPLCSTCSDIENFKQCKHDDKDRCLSGTWTHVELQHAISRGYTIKEIYEVWHWKNTSTNLFKEYINAYLKLKVEASGYPSWCITEEDKDRYLEDWKVSDGLLLDKTQIHPNPGIRTISKLALNSLWGKFSQRQNFSKNKYISSYTELQNMIANPDYDVTDLLLVGERMALVTYKSKRELEQAAPFSNLPIAIFTTSHARLHLLQQMEQVQDRILYTDTDSIIYVSRHGEPDLPESSLLGGLKSELSNKQYITEFYCTGAKSYYYKVAEGTKTFDVFKIKGFKLSKENLLTLQNSNFVNLAQKGKESLILDNFSITRNKLAGELINNENKKKLKNTFNKRILKKNFDTYAIGDKLIDENELL